MKEVRADSSIVWFGNPLSSFPESNLFGAKGYQTRLSRCLAFILAQQGWRGVAFFQSQQTSKDVCPEHARVAELADALDSGSSS
jgi:hypothetical protein